MAKIRLIFAALLLFGVFLTAVPVKANASNAVLTPDFKLINFIDGGPIGSDLYMCAADIVVNDPLTTQGCSDKAVLTEQDVTRALLAYRRAGLSGLGESTLAGYLAPQIVNPFKRGEHVHQFLKLYLDEVVGMGSNETMVILQGELVKQSSPGELSQELGLSLSEYYRRRHEAVLVLLDMLTRNDR